MRLVKAKEMGFYNGSRVRPGTTITVSDTFRAKWVEDLTPPPAPEPVAPEPAPRRTYSRRSVGEASSPATETLV